MIRFPRLRVDPMKPEKGGKKRQRQALQAVLNEDIEVMTFHVAKMVGKSWPKWRRDQYIAWAEWCGEDEYGFIGQGDTPEMALMRMMTGFHRLVHMHRHPDRYEERQRKQAIES